MILYTINFKHIIERYKGSDYLNIQYSKNEIGKRIRSERKAAGFKSAASFGDKLNIGRSQVEQIEQGNPITITDPNMTRFMMTLDDAVDLVIYAFTHGKNGDLFVQKAPAATLEVLAEALKETYALVDAKYSETEVKTIGTRHGEKLYETLVTREEMAKAIDMGEYFCIPCDNRDLNYDKFFTEGNKEIAKIEDYDSHNTGRLDVEGMKKLLLKLRFIREDLGLDKKAKSTEIKSE